MQLQKCHYLIQQNQGIQRTAKKHLSAVEKLTKKSPRSEVILLVQTCRIKEEVACKLTKVALFRKSCERSGLTMSNQNAAGLQIAIWELVGGSNFQLNSSLDYGAGDMLAWVNNNPTAPNADLIAVTGPGQDYVIPSVPDGGETVLLLGCGFAGLFVMRFKFGANRFAK
jgi:hypothetical protein